MSSTGTRSPKKAGMGGRVNTIMQTCFFAISGVLPREEAIEAIKHSIKKTYGGKGEEVVRKNFEAVDQTLANLFEVKVPGQATSQLGRPPVVAPEAPEFVQKVTAHDHREPRRHAAGERLPVDGTFPDRNGTVGEAKHRARDTRLGSGDLHPVRQVRARLPARRDPHQGVRREAHRRRRRPSSG